MPDLRFDFMKCQIMLKRQYQHQLEFGIAIISLQHLV